MLWISVPEKTYRFLKCSFNLPSAIQLLSNRNGDGTSSAILLLIYHNGAVAQLGEHLLCKQGVKSSRLFSSTINLGTNTQQKEPSCVSKRAYFLPCTPICTPVYSKSVSIQQVKLKSFTASSCILGMTWEYMSRAFHIPLKSRYKSYKCYIIVPLCSGRERTIVLSRR